MRLLRVFILTQAAGLLLAFLAFKSGLSSFWMLLSLQSVTAVLLAKLCNLPYWWLPIQALFIPSVLYTASLNIPSGFFLAGFILLWLLFKSNTRERVPLYLTNPTTRQALNECLPQKTKLKFIDLGCGFAGNLAYLAKQNPNGLFYGVESAPLPFAIGWLRTRRLGNAEVLLKNLWQENLEAYDVVYAFLSPQPMPQLWNKAQKEMRKGSLLISNSFEIPGITPDKTLTLNDARQTRLLIWKIGSKPGSAPDAA